MKPTMATRNDFSPEQWQALRNAPQLVALATAAAGNSGLFGSLSEGMAMASTIAETLRGQQPLLKEVFAKDEMKAAQEQIKTSLKSVTDRASLNSYLQKAATDAVQAALSALTAKGAGADADAFRTMLTGIGEKVANASTEGGFLGFGGERVSEGERQFLAQLNTVIGTQHA
jgi:hypothetical protein